MHANSNRNVWALLLSCLALVAAWVHAEETAAKDCLLFSYFKSNGEDGPHLAYSEDGLHWKALNGDKSFLTPTAGRDKLMRDPSILLGPDNVYHLVWTVSWKEKGIGYASSKDLIHWSDQKYIPVMEHESDANNSWAPELFYDDVAKQYLIIWATTIPGRFPETDGQSSKCPPEPGLNHRLYYVTTKDFETFSKTALFYDKGFNVIDASIVKDGNRYAMFLKDETNKPFAPQKNIRLAFSDRAEGPYSAPTEPITGAYWAEGPTGIKIDGRWFVYCDRYRDNRFGLVVSDDLKTWRDLSDQLVMPKGIKHGTVFRAPEETVQKLLSLE